MAYIGMIVVALVCSLTSGAASAGLDPALKCEVTRLKLAGSYVSCVTKAEAKAVKVRVTPDFSMCDAVLAKRWTASARRALARDSACASLSGDSAGDVILLRENLVQLKNIIDDVLHGIRFVNNGDGTISDYLTGLMWEEKIDFPDTVHWQPGDDCLHCALNFVSAEIARGPWLATVNGFVAVEGGGGPGAQSGLGGHSDWRLPTVAELLTLGPVLSGAACQAGGTSTCDEPVFGPTAYFDTITASATPSYEAWMVNFQGSPSFTSPSVVEFESTNLLVRAVRTLP